MSPGPQLRLTSSREVLVCERFQLQSRWSGSLGCTLLVTFSLGSGGGTVGPGERQRVPRGVGTWGCDSEAQSWALGLRGSWKSGARAGVVVVREPSCGTRLWNMVTVEGSDGWWARECQVLDLPCVASCYLCSGIPCAWCQIYFGVKPGVTVPSEQEPGPRSPGEGA